LKIFLSQPDLSSPAAKLIPIDPSDLQPASVFPEKRRNQPNTLTTPPRESLPGIQRWKQAVWKFQARLREPDIKYASKVGLGTGERALISTIYVGSVADLPAVCSHARSPSFYGSHSRHVSRISRGMGFDSILGHHESLYRRNKPSVVLSSRRHVVSRPCPTLVDLTRPKADVFQQLGSGCRCHCLHFVSGWCGIRLPRN